MNCHIITIITGRSEETDFMSEQALSYIDEEDEFADDQDDGESLREKDPVFEKIKETLSKSQQRSESAVSMLTSDSDESDSPHVQISQHYTSIPYGIQPRATYEHSSQHADIMGVSSFHIIDLLFTDMKQIQTKDLTPKTFELNQVRRALQYPKYEYRLIMHIVYAPKYNCYFALGKDFSVKVLNRDFEETCSVNTDMRSVLYILFNPVKDELITGGVGGIKIWLFQQAAGKVFTELKPLANYELRLKIVVSADGVMWMGFTDDKLLYISTCRNITLWHLNNFYSFWALARNHVSSLSLASCEDKTTRILAVGDDSSVIIQAPSQSVTTHRATENGNGNEIISNCCSLCILNSTAMMMTDEGLCCPIRHTYLLLGMEDGRILFMDPVIKGQKYMEFKASKDAIQEMRHDVGHRCLITLCRLKTLVLIQIWGLPQLDAMYELYCGPDITCYARVGLSVLTGHSSGQVNLHPLEPVEDLGITKPKQEPSYESVVDEKRRPEHHASVVAMDSLTSLNVFVTCSCDGGIKIWDEDKVLLTEVMLEESLSSACFLNDMGDLLVAFKNHIFYIDHTKLCPTFKPPEIEMETSDQESDVYEDPRVLYEMLREDDEPVTLENYLVPFDHLEFDKDFLEGKTKIEQPKTAAEAAMESMDSETETDISLAPSSIYLSPSESIESLSMIDLTLGADYSKYDLRDQMKATLDYMGTKGRKRGKGVSIETPAQSDQEDKDIDTEMEKFSLPMFGDSPGGSPSITPPSGQASPRRDHLDEDEDYSDEEMIQKRPSGFVPIIPDQAGTPASKLEQPKAGYIDEDTGDTSTRRMKGMKVDVRGMMKKRRITSGRAPSLTRRSSADHMHDEHDHDHDHGHHRTQDTTDVSMAHLHMEDGTTDADLLQEEQWASEAGVHGQTLKLPPQKDKNRARPNDKNDSRFQRNRGDRKSVYDERKSSIEGQTPGVGSSPTAELEREDGLIDRDKSDKLERKSDHKLIKHRIEAEDQAGKLNIVYLLYCCHVIV
ncbi:hypothetical protein ACF0H5_013896 [Mactra antiquata]